jgi:hypothetical protein
MNTGANVRRPSHQGYSHGKTNTGVADDQGQPELVEYSGLQMLLRHWLGAVHAAIVATDAHCVFCALAEFVDSDIS